MNPVFQEHVLNAVDICNNCFQVVRVERDGRPEDQYRSDVTVKEAQWARNRKTMSVEYAPADQIKDSKGVFCSCGVEGSFVRTWDGETIGIYEQIFDNVSPDVSREKFRRLVQNALRTLEEKGVSVDRKTFAYHALEARRDGKCVNEALSEGVTYAIAKAEASSRTRVTA